MTIIVFFQIFFVCLLGAMSPGPSMIVVINNAIFRSRFHGILTSIGHGLGIALYALFAVIGIELIIEANLMIFTTMKLLSLILLIYLGLKSILNKNKLNFDERNFQGKYTSFLQGFSISILNPKIFIWFVAIYSQFMSVNNNFILNTSLVLIAGITDTLWYIFLTMTITSPRILEIVKTKSLILNKCIGVLLILIAAVLLLDIIFNQT